MSYPPHMSMMPPMAFFPPGAPMMIPPNVSNFYCSLGKINCWFLIQMATPPPGIPTATNGTHKLGENDKVCLLVFDCLNTCWFLFLQKNRLQAPTTVFVGSISDRAPDTMIKRMLHVSNTDYKTYRERKEIHLYLVSRGFDILCHIFLTKSNCQVRNFRV